MNILKFLNKFFFQFFLFLIIFPLQGEEAVDIWNENNLNEPSNTSITVEDANENESTIYETIKPLTSNIKEENDLEKEEEEIIFGLFDPEENNL